MKVTNNASSRRNIVLLCGGHSNEYDVSLLSALEVASNIDTERFNLFIILIPKNDNWKLITFEQLKDLSKTDSALRTFRDVDMACDGSRRLLDSEGGVIANNIYAVIPMLHGSFGEDGTLQALLDVGDYDYIGPGFDGSNNAFDKILCKQIMEANDIPVVPYIKIDETNPATSYTEAKVALGTEEMVIKPSRSGSSIGVILVQGEREYKKAVAEAKAAYGEILIEKRVEPLREIELAVKTGRNGVEASMPGEIHNQNKTYGYQEKYSDAKKIQIEIPANLPNGMKRKIRRYALKACKSLDCEQLARVDFFVSGKDVYLNEINTSPGFTKNSMYPMLWHNEGVDLRSLITELIEHARHKTRKAPLSMEKIIIMKLKLLAKLFIRRHKPTVIGVAGSVGKTGTKRHIATVLSQKYRVQYNPGSYNSEIGLPLSLLQEEVPKNVRSITGWLGVLWRAAFKVLKPAPYDVLVAEYGVDQPGDMVKLLDIIKPDIAVLTAISPEHMEMLGNMETVANEELQILRAAKTTILNGDDVLEKWQQRVDGTFLSYGRHNFTLKVGKDLAAEVTIKTDSGMYHAKNLHNIGDNTGLGLSAAALVAERMDMTEAEINQALEGIEPVPGRMRLLRGVDGSLIVDDSYNASPLAVVSALNAMRSLKADRRIVVLGGMNEMGEYAQKAYAQALQNIDGIDEFITLGTQANELFVKELHGKGVAAKKIHSFEDPTDAGRFIADELKPRSGDVILVKGSQNGVYSEETVKLLLANKSDTKHLVRQSDFWMQKKRECFGW